MEENDLIIETTLLAGKIMIENGSDMARIDDTLKRFAKNSGISDPDIFETTTGIMMSIKGANAQVIAIKKHRIDLERIAMVNEISRAYEEKRKTLPEVHTYLKQLDENAPDFRPIWLVLAAGIVGCTLEIIYNGLWQDFLPTFVISALGYYIFYLIDQRLKVKFASEFIAAIVIGFLAVMAARLGLAKSYEMVIIGSVMPLVPGVPLTNAMRDLLAGHTLSGLARVAEGFLSAGAIGMGIACVLRFL